VPAAPSIPRKIPGAHRSNIYAKLGLQSDYQLRMLARRGGIITLT
jgi:hypothetical protein